MRVVAGEARGRKLAAPLGIDTRPTSDRVREATFNALVSMGEVDGAEVLDLYAGSGAMGIEALSRGAERATFVERDRAALRAIELNLAATGLTDRARVVAADAMSWLRTGSVEHFDLGLCDPPYAFDAWSALLDLLPSALVVAESDRALGTISGWEVVREKRYGSTVVSIARRTATEGAP